jgi:hypothetical protein
MDMVVMLKYTISNHVNIKLNFSSSKFYTFSMYCSTKAIKRSSMITFRVMCVDSLLTSLVIHVVYRWYKNSLSESTITKN